MRLTNQLYVRSDITPLGPSPAGVKVVFVTQFALICNRIACLLIWVYSKSLLRESHFLLMDPRLSSASYGRSLLHVYANLPCRVTYQVKLSRPTIVPAANLEEQAFYAGSFSVDTTATGQPIFKGLTPATSNTLAMSYDPQMPNSGSFYFPQSVHSGTYMVLLPHLLIFTAGLGLDFS
jgi:hypothetical protein